MSTNNETQYAGMDRPALIIETTRLALAVEAAQNRGQNTKALELEEQHHLAMVALIDKTVPADEAARYRQRNTRERHMVRAGECRRMRLGLSEAVPA